MKQNIRQIVLPKRIVQQASEHFENNLPSESLLFVFGKSAPDSNGRKNLFALETLVPEDEDYAQKSSASCEISYKFIARHFPRLLENLELVATWHSHPIDGLSGTDMHDGHEVMARVFPNQLTGYYNRGRFAFYQCNDDFEEVRCEVVDTEIYDRQVRFLGELSQLKLAASKVSIVGCGGLGFQITLLLAQKGIRNFTLADPDAWDKTSMHRVWIPPSHINRNKAESLAEIVGERGINARALPFKEESVPPSELDADILIIATDSISSRIIGNNLAIELRRPAVIVGTEIGPHNQQTMVGECRVYLPEKTPCYRCNLSVDPLQLARETENPENWRKFASKYGLPLDSDPVPSLVDLNTMVASLASDEVTKIITGIHEPIPHQYIDFLNRRLIRIEATRNPECPSCRQVEAVQLGDSDIIQTETALKAPTA